MRSLRNTERVLNNAGVERLMETERAKGDKLVIGDIINLKCSSLGRLPRGRSSRSIPLADTRVKASA
jgi:hypothetical protein